MLRLNLQIGLIYQSRSKERVEFSERKGTNEKE